MIRRLAKLTRRSPPFAGNCDGLDRADVHGWAWRPDAPQLRVEVEQWVDGVLKATIVADQPRDDLAEAGIGDGAYAWRMPLALDPAKTTPQTVEFRVRGGGALANGVFVSIHVPTVEAVAETAPKPEPAPAPGADSAVGVCDGYDGGLARGWAWRPLAPEDRVIVEAWMDGTLVAETVADVLRADLAAAGIGDGRYAWELPLTPPSQETGPQTVELRIRGAGPVAGGSFTLEPAPQPASDAAAALDAPAGLVIGHCDGLKGSALHGWAKDTAHPDEPVEVELWLDGVCAARAIADGFRPDLRSSHVGSGRYGWRLPVDLRKLEKPVQAEVRARGGQVLEGGRLELQNNLALDNPINADLLPFVEAVLQAHPQAPSPKPLQRTFLLYAPPATQESKFWSREHDDYPGAMTAFVPALERLGEVVVLEDLAEAAAICAERREPGRECLLLSFGPPRQAPLEAPCPIVPAFAWAFPTLPTGAWDGDARSDWRKVLGFAGRAITFSQAAAEAVRAAMGPAFPVAALPPPVRARALPQAGVGRRTLRLEGAVFDSRDYVFDPEQLVMPTRVWTGNDEAAAGKHVEIEGVLFTAVLDLDDKRKSWHDFVSAFVAAHREHADATLLLKLTWPSAEWMPELYKWLAVQPTFACRVLAVRGPMDEAAYSQLIAASHWCVSSSNAEGLCLAIGDFMAAGRPAVAPRHTAIADLLDQHSGLVVDCDEEDWRWPLEPEDGGWSWTQHPDDVGPTTRWRVSWLSLFNAVGEAYRLVTEAPEAYGRLSAAAAENARTRHSPEATAEALAELLQAPREAPAGALPRSLTLELAAG